MTTNDGSKSRIPSLLSPMSSRAPAAAALLFAILLPVMLPTDQWIRVGAVALIYVGLASGLNILVGFTGLLDLGYIAFFVVGAYTTSIVSVRLLKLDPIKDLSTAQWIGMCTAVIAVLFAIVFGIVLGYPTLRARGDYLAIMTLAFGEIVRIVVINWNGLTGGAVGVRGIAPLGIGGAQFLSATAVYYSVLVLVTPLLVAIVLIIASPVGRAWVAIREDELVAASMGIRTRRYKLLAYVTGASVASLVGVVFAHMQQFINPDSFTLDDNFVVLSVVILGGAGTIWGPPVGAFAWIFFSNWARDQPIVQQHPEFQLGSLALIVIALMIWRPEGIVRTRPRLSRVSAGRGSAPAKGGAEQPSLHPVKATTGSEVLLSAIGLSQTFGGVKALCDVSLAVEQRQIVGLMGPNGAGKSTLLNVLSGVTPPTSGTFHIAGESAAGLGSDRLCVMGVARTFQNIRLFGNMTVTENLLVGAHERCRTAVPKLLLRTPEFKRRETEAMADAVRVLNFVGLESDRHRVASTLSYGHQRRLEIARALMTRPSLLMLDEPAAGMNESESRDLAKLVLRIRDAGVAVLLIEHDMDLLMSVSDRVVVLNYGSVIASGTPDDVRADPVVLDAYLGAAS